MPPELLTHLSAPPAASPGFGSPSDSICIRRGSPVALPSGPECGRAWGARWTFPSPALQSCGATPKHSSPPRPPRRPQATWPRPRLVLNFLGGKDEGRPQGCFAREGTSEAVRQAVGGGCRSGWGRLLSVTNAVEAGNWRRGDSGWA